MLREFLSTAHSAAAGDMQTPWAGLLIDHVQSQEVLGFGDRRDRAPDFRAQRGGGSDLLDIRRSVIPVFDADPEVSAPFERGARDRRVEQRTAEERDGPRN